MRGDCEEQVPGVEEGGEMIMWDTDYTDDSDEDDLINTDNMSKSAKLDIEEKFKRDISKEVANLKEFLISQGKEIVKLKQENKV